MRSTAVLCGLCCAFTWVLTAQQLTIVKNTQVGRLAEAQVELISSNGVRVLIDVADPEALSAPVTDRDILLTTHLHADHFNQEFADSFPGRQLRMEKGEIRMPRLRIRSVVSSHSPTPPDKPGGGDNYIFIVEVDGLRVAHFGDCEQEELTRQQLAELKGIDVAIVELYFSSSVKIIDRIKPRLVIPTHIWGSPVMKSLVQQWPAVRTDEARIGLTRKSLPKETTVLFMGDWGRRIGGMFKLPEWKAP